MLATLLVAMIALWAMSTVRHAVAADTRASDHQIREPLDRAA